jgi:hypothetical protein
MLGNNKKSIGFNSNFYTNKSDFSAEALQWKTNIINNGGTISDALLTIFDNNFFKPAKANGNILNQLDRLNIYCGLVGFEIAARTNMINANHFVTPVSSPTFNSLGYTSSGTSYLNLNYKALSQGIKYTLDDCFYGCVIRNPAFLISQFPIGSQDNAGNNTSRMRRQLNNLNVNVNNNFAQTTSLTTGSISGNVLIGAKRINNNNQFAILNNTISPVATRISSALNNFDFYELTYNSGNSPAGAFDLTPHSASFCGSSNFDDVAFMTIFNNLYTALGL